MKKSFLIVLLILCVASVCFAYNTKVYKEQGGAKLVVASGGTLELKSGSTFTVADGSIAAGDIALADTKLLIGGATGVAAAKSMSGDATIANTGALTISAGAVEDSMIEALADGEFIIGTDGTAANNAKVTMSGDGSLANDGTFTLAGRASRNIRTRVTLAELNAGHELLPATAGKQYRIISINAIAIGGNLGTATSVEIEGTQSAGSVDLFSIAAAGLTQSTVNTIDGANTTVLADGASFILNDANTAIDISATGTADTITNIDIIIDYMLE